MKKAAAAIVPVADMKTILATLSLALVSVSSAQSPMFQPPATTGAVLGAIAGAFIGGHNHNLWAEGAAIGAVAGALIGTAVTPPPVYQSVPVYQAAPVYQGGMVYAQAPVVYAPAPQVVYVQHAPRVVYLPAPPPVVYYAPAAVGYRYAPSYGHRVGPGYHPGNSHRGHGRR
jgi:hypothetical protein